MQLWWMNLMFKSLFFHDKSSISGIFHSHKLCRRSHRRRTECCWETARRWSPSRAAAADLRLLLRTQIVPPAPEPGPKHSGSASTTRPTTSSGTGDSSSLQCSTDTVRPAVLPSEESRGRGEGSGRHGQPTQRRSEVDWRRGRGGRTNEWTEEQRG